jgi:hypothetical protein
VYVVESDALTGTELNESFSDHDRKLAPCNTSLADRAGFDEQPT